MEQPDGGSRRKCYVRQHQTWRRWCEVSRSREARAIGFVRELDGCRRCLGSVEVWDRYSRGVKLVIGTKYRPPGGCAWMDGTYGSVQRGSTLGLVGTLTAHWAGTALAGSSSRLSTGASP